MDKEVSVFRSVDEYISAFHPDVQEKMNFLRQEILALAPGVEERISYNMPAYHLNGSLLYFAAFKKHIGFYPTQSGINAYKEQLSKYKTAKGSIKLPLDQPLPVDLIREIIKFRVAENIERAQAKKRRE